MYFRNNTIVLEIGPRMTFSTAWSSNCVSMLVACGIDSISRIERSRRYQFTSTAPLSKSDLGHLASALHDRMTECIYEAPLTSFTPDGGSGSEPQLPEPVREIPVLSGEGGGGGSGGGVAALAAESERRGLGWDEWDLQYYSAMFRDTLQRNPTDVECFDLGECG